MENREDYGTLLALADLDARRRELAAAAKTLPEAIAARETELAARRGEAAKAQGEVEALLRERRRLEAAVTDKTGLVAKYRAQLDTVKTNKEYQSLQHEIEATRGEVLAAEDKLLELMETLERAQTGGAARGEAAAAKEEEVAAANARDQGRLRDVEVQLVEVEEKRKRLLPQLSQSIRNEYQRLFDHYPGDAFAVARNGVCQGCFVNIPAKVISELQAGGRLYRCESCARFILVADEDWEPRPVSS